MLATVDDLATYLGTEFAAGAETDRATLALELATAEIQAAAGQRLLHAVDDEVALVGSGVGVLLLPELPVAAVASVVAGDALAEGTDYRVGEAGILWRLGGSVWELGAIYTVTYEHGFAQIPGDLKAVAVAYAARTLGNPEQLTREQIGTYGVGYPRPGLLESEIDVIARYRVA